MERYTFDEFNDSLIAKLEKLTQNADAATGRERLDAMIAADAVLIELLEREPLYWSEPLVGLKIVEWICLAALGARVSFRPHVQDATGATVVSDVRAESRLSENASKCLNALAEAIRDRANPEYWFSPSELQAAYKDTLRQVRHARGLLRSKKVKLAKTQIARHVGLPISAIDQIEQQPRATAAIARSILTARSDLSSEQLRALVREATEAIAEAKLTR